MAESRRTVPFWATFFTALTMILLCGLGTWQVKRQIWKTEIITGLQAAYQAGPQDRPLTLAQLRNAAAEKKLFLYGHIDGHFLNDKEIPLGPRTRNGVAGYHIVTPFVLEGGGTILVNRGFVTEEQKTPASRPDSMIEGTTEIAGLARRPEWINPIIPANVPEKNEWFRADIHEMAAAKNLQDAAPYFFYAETVPGMPVADPAGHDRSWRPVNNHLQYAGFWFLTACALAVIYTLRFIRRAPSGK